LTTDDGLLTDEYPLTPAKNLYNNGRFFFPHNVFFCQAVRVNRRIQRKIDQILAALRPYEPERIYLFGSAAFGEADALSDIDVVVIMRSELSFLDRLRQVGRSLPAEVGGIDILVYTPDEFASMQREGNAFAEMVTEEGRLIYGG